MDWARRVIEHDVWPVHDELVRGSALAPVTLGGAEERAWLDCDLASLAENWLDDRTDPREIDAAQRRSLRSRVLDEPPMSLAQRSEHERCYWLLDGAERKGTMALSTGTLGSTAFVWRASTYSRLTAETASAAAR